MFREYLITNSIQEFNEIHSNWPYITPPTETFFMVLLDILEIVDVSELFLFAVLFTKGCDKTFQIQSRMDQNLCSVHTFPH